MYEMRYDETGEQCNFKMTIFNGSKYINVQKWRPGEKDCFHLIEK